MYKNCNSHAEQSECIANLVIVCESLRKRLGYSDQDARALVLNNLRSISYASQMTINLLDRWAIGDEAVRSIIPQLLGIKEITQRSLKIAGDMLHKTAKLSLVLLGQFQIENCLRTLARELNLSSRQTGFYRMAEGLLIEIGIPNDRLEILNTPALIRNSLHSNGIHHGYGGVDTVVTVGGIVYQFCHEKRVQCATIEHIAHALETSVGVLDEVFHSPKVIALADPIMDQYVGDLADNARCSRGNAIGCPTWQFR